MDRSLTVCLVLAGCFAALFASNTSAAEGSAGSDVPDIGVMPHHTQRAHLPIIFEPNEGQAGPDVRFLTRQGGQLTLILDNEIVLVQRSKPGDRAVSDGSVRIRFDGARAPRGTEGIDPTGGVSNYYRGRDRAHWWEGVPHYRRVILREVYPGIDVNYHGDKGQLEFDFEVAPGVAPEKVLLAVEGAAGLETTASGDVTLLTTQGGEIRLRRPVVYQWIGDTRVEIAADFAVVGDDRLAFDIGLYDETRPLVIDPVVEYATFLGGSENDTINSATLDADGNSYVTGATDSFSYPAANGFDTLYDAFLDVIVTKMNADGSKLLFSTYMGGDDSEVGNAITLDAEGMIYVAGYTENVGSSGFEFPTTEGVFDDTLNGEKDAWVAQIDPNAGTLVFATLLGGSRLDEAKAIRVDGLGEVHVVGETAGSFPTTPGAYDRVYAGGGTDLFYVKLDSAGTELLYSTYLGASGAEVSPAMQIDDAGHVYIAGTTNSIDLPATPGILQGERSGGMDLFLLKTDTSGDPPEFWTYLGGNQDEGDASLALDVGHNIYITGFTEGFEFPVSANALFPEFGGVRDAFIVKLDMTASVLLYGSFLGGAGADGGAGIVVDQEGSITLTGTTSSADFPVTMDAEDGVYSGGQDIFITKMGGSGDRLLYSSYFGAGNKLAAARNSLLLDASASTVVAGSFEFTGTESLPTTPGAHRMIRPLGQFNGYLVKFNLSEFSGPPQINAGGIVGAGLSIPPVRAISPNGIFTIYGSVFAPQGTSVGVLPADLVDGRVPTRLADVCVEVGGRRSPMFAVRPNQLNVQSPSVLPADMADVVVIADCDGANEQRSNVAMIATAEVTPEFFYFALNEDGVNPIAAANIVTGALIGPPGLFGKGALTTVPAFNDDFVVLYATGFGLTDPPFEAGELARFPAAEVILPAGTHDRRRRIEGSRTASMSVFHPRIGGTCTKSTCIVRRAVPQGNQPVRLKLGDILSSPGGFIPVEPAP